MPNIISDGYSSESIKLKSISNNSSIKEELSEEWNDIPTKSIDNINLKKDFNNKPFSYNIEKKKQFKEDFDETNSKVKRAKLKSKSNIQKINLVFNWGKN